MFRFFTMEPTDWGIDLIDFLTIIAIISLYYLKWKKIRNVESFSYILLSGWFYFVSLAIAGIWNKSWPLIGHILTIISFTIISCTRIGLLALAIRPAIITAITTKDE